MKNRGLIVILIAGMVLQGCQTNHYTTTRPIPGIGAELVLTMSADYAERFNFAVFQLPRGDYWSAWIDSEHPRNSRNLIPGKYSIVMDQDGGYVTEIRLTLKPGTQVTLFASGTKEILYTCLQVLGTTTLILLMLLGLLVISH